MASQGRLVLRRSFSSVFGGGSGGARSFVPYSVASRVNTVINIVPQQERWVVERLGKYNRTLDAGIHVLLPVLDRIAYVHSLKEVAFEIAGQTAITKDNVHLALDGVAYIRVFDPLKASYEVADPFFAIVQLAQTTMRSEVGKLTLDKLFAEREQLNQAIVESIEKVAMGWGIKILRYEIRDISVPTSIRQAMDLEAEAERKKRKQILESEGEKQSEMNVAEGRKTATVLLSEAAATERINYARGEAEGILMKAQATAKGIAMVAESLGQSGAKDAVAMRLAEDYISAWSNLAKKGTTVIVPENPSDVSGLVTKAWTVMQSISLQNQQQAPPPFAAPTAGSPAQ